MIRRVCFLPLVESQQGSREPPLLSLSAMPEKSVRIEEHFAELTDPRRGTPLYPLVNVVTIALCAVICGADDFVAIAKYGNTKRDWLSKFLDLSAGIPSHDRF